MPQPMELRTLPDGRTGYLCYCLGNLISNQFDPYTNLTAAVTLTLTRSGETGRGDGFRRGVRAHVHARKRFQRGTLPPAGYSEIHAGFLSRGIRRFVNRSVYDRMKQGTFRPAPYLRHG